LLVPLLFIAKAKVSAKRITKNIQRKQVFIFFLPIFFKRLILYADSQKPNSFFRNPDLSRFWNGIPYFLKQYPPLNSAPFFEKASYIKKGALFKLLQF
jgi:hypothetical protein